MENKESITINVDKIIQKLIQSHDKNQKQRPSQAQIKLLCYQARQILLDQPSILELSAPVKICGDIHGQFSDLIKLFEYAGFPPSANYLFLGDYVDRGKQSVQTIILLLAYKVKYPQNFFLLRGNHQCSSINRLYGFYDQCKRKYNLKTWKAFSDCFNVMPICALVGQKILCMHGGLSPDFDNYQQIFNIRRPLQIPEKGLLCDILWSDPQKNTQGYKPNDRGLSYVFGEDIVKQFLQKHDLDLICRAHQVVQQGYQFFGGRRLVTIFSAPNYCNQYDNRAAMMNVDQSLVCSFQIIKAKKKVKISS